MAAGAMWVWVAEIIWRLTGMPVWAKARRLASSMSSRGSMQESATAMAVLTSPYWRTRRMEFI
jgi:uncharacterized protein (DUF2126 family)